MNIMKGDQSSMSNNDVITLAHAHSILKFNQIEMYIGEWAHKLLNYSDCQYLVYIDCMCNSGIYKTSNEEIIKGSALRVANILSMDAKKYENKRFPQETFSFF